MSTAWAMPTGGEILDNVRASVAAIRHPRQALYVRSSLQTDQVLVIDGSALGHDRSIFVIPTDEHGDRVLDAIRGLGFEPVEWTSTAPHILF